MRLLVALCVWVVIVGGLALYMNVQETTHAGPAVVEQRAAGTFTLEITPSFTAEPDPFALLLDEKIKPPALVVKLNGTEVVRKTDRVGAGKPLRVEAIAGMVTGANEFYVEASPPADQIGRASAVRVRVLRDDEPIAERTLWSEPGMRIATTFQLTIQAGASPRRHETHDH